MAAISPDARQSAGRLTVRCRVADRHARVLRRMARQVNQVWNYCNETSYRAITRDGRWLHHFDFVRAPLKGTSLAIAETWMGDAHIPQLTVGEVAKEYCTRRDQFRRTYLRWRGSVRHKSNYSLGWVPFHKQTIRYEGGEVRFARTWFQLRNPERLDEEELEFGAGSFVETAEGHWYFCVTVKKPASTESRHHMQRAQPLGVHLGRNHVAGASDGRRLDADTWRLDGPARERVLQRQLLASQKKHGRPGAGLSARLLRLHRRVLNRRRDALHKFANRLVREASAVFIGGLATGRLPAPGKPKSVFDPAYGDLARMLVYKCTYAGITCESATEGEELSQTCSSCGAEAPRGTPQGLGGGGMREWGCDACGAVLDRTVNAARNVLAAGLGRLAEGNRPP